MEAHDLPCNTVAVELEEQLAEDTRNLTLKHTEGNVTRTRRGTRGTTNTQRNDEGSGNSWAGREARPANEEIKQEEETET